MKEKMLYSKANEIRKLTIKAIGGLGTGHIGGAMSICELLAVLYFKEMNIDPQMPKMKERDRFVLSKGHGGPAVYSALALKGYLPIAELETLNRPNTNLPSHCDMRRTNGVDMTTGSLGQGFSAAAGMAQAAKMDKSGLYIYTVIGDGESNEGQVWETAMFAAAKNLDNIVAFTDYNHMQLDGLTEDISGLEPLDEKWKAFGWHVQSIDGHDIKQILYAIDIAKKIKGKPSMIIMNTIKGKGCSFCENDLANHNMVITSEMMNEALRALDDGGDENNA